EVVWRRADVDRICEHTRLVPRLGTTGIGADREIAVQADRHAGLARGARGLRELQVALPLQVEVKIDVVGVISRELAHRRRGSIAVRLGPCGPSPRAGIATSEVRLQG